MGLSYRTWNDTKTATYNADFLENWAAAFPDLLTHEWCVCSHIVSECTSDVKHRHGDTFGLHVTMPAGTIRLASELPRVASRRYLVGESYAGVYVPTLARELLHRESTRDCAVARALRGLAVGDGCVGTEVLCGGGGGGPGPYFRLEFLHGHGQFSHRLYERMRRVCPREQLVGYNGVTVQVMMLRKLTCVAAEKRPRRDRHTQRGKRLGYTGRSR